MNATTVQENIARVKERMATAAARAGRKAEEVTLIGVSKTHPASAIHEAYEAGLRHFGENRVQEWEGKRGALDLADARWHLIGHLQSNKAARAAKAFHCIDSIDDGNLALRLERACVEGEGAGKKLRVLIEVHLGGEESKSGVAEGNLPALAESIEKLERLELAGLMCIPPYLEQVDDVRPYFARLRELKEETEQRLARVLPVLSMGMSHDFEAAIQEGATEVRVGTAIFGTRPAIK
ncbi:MAG TPA: YggS family pyridoxal phosphate-dependent enzyme [Candidatus Acidoferrum sp.]